MGTEAHALTREPAEALLPVAHPQEPSGAGWVRAVFLVQRRAGGGWPPSGRYAHLPTPGL